VPRQNPGRGRASCDTRSHMRSSLTSAHSLCAQGSNVTSAGREQDSRVVQAGRTVSAGCIGVQQVAQEAAARHLGDCCDAEEVRQRGEPAKDVEQAPIVEVAKLGDPQRALPMRRKLRDVCTHGDCGKGRSTIDSTMHGGGTRGTRGREEQADMKRPFTICAALPSMHSTDVVSVLGALRW